MISVTLKDIVRAAIIVIITLNHLMMLCIFISNLSNKVKYKDTQYVGP